MEHEDKNDAGKDGQAPENPSRMGFSGVESPQGGGEGRGPESPFGHEVNPRGSVREDSPELRNPIRDRHQPGIPGTRIKDPSEVLLQAFLDGDFEKAYQAALDLKGAYHEALLEASRQRYRANFGTQACDNCEGLKAGPGVVATCFQVQKCNFDSIHEGSESQYHLRVIDRLSLK